MAATNINRVVLTGNLTRDPELRSLPSGMSVCKLRVAVNTRRKDNSTGEWADKPNFFDVTVWGAQGENCAQYLSKGRPVAIDGRLEWREWTKDDEHRAAVEIVADLIRRGQGAGRYRTDFDPAIKAVEILAFVNGMETAWLLDPSIPLNDVFKQYGESLARDFAPPAAATASTGPDRSAT